jgi:hypothetical protein
VFGVKGCAISSVLHVLAWLATGGVIVFLLERQYGLSPEKIFAPSLFIALLIVIGVGLIVGAIRLLRERTQIAAALRGESPRDGKRVVLVGTIHATREPLIAPLSAKACVAFRYDISRWSGSGKHRSLVVLVDGVALTESHLRTAAGEYRLLAVPMFDTEAEPLGDSARRRAEEHLRFGSFTERQPAFTRPEIEKEWTDDDGAYRRERRYIKDEIALEECLLSEYVIRDGAEVVVNGLYSAERRGIVPHPNWAHLTQLTTGNPAQAARRLRQRAIRYVVFAVLMFAGARFMSYSVFGV